MSHPGFPSKAKVAGLDCEKKLETVASESDYRHGTGNLKKDSANPNKGKCEGVATATSGKQVKTSSPHILQGCRWRGKMSRKDEKGPQPE